MKKRITIILNNIDKKITKLFHKSLKLPKSVNDFVVTLIPFVVVLEAPISFTMIIISLFFSHYLNVLLNLCIFILTLKLIPSILKQKLIGLKLLKINLSFILLTSILNMNLLFLLLILILIWIIYGLKNYYNN